MCDWSVSKYSVKHDRHTAPCTATHCATRCTALRESPTHGSVVERDSVHVYYRAHFYNWLCISPRIGAPSGGPCVDLEDCEWKQSKWTLLLFQITMVNDVRCYIMPFLPSYNLHIRVSVISVCATVWLSHWRSFLRKLYSLHMYHCARDKVLTYTYFELQSDRHIIML